MFKCDVCGLCCKQLQLNPAMAKMHAGDGVCLYLDLETNKCTIYNERPLLCNVDMMYETFYSDQMTREEFYEKNYEVCKKLKAGLPLD